ncbi:MAG TPA: hypothetical protein DCY20_06895 [Firmicutes bacterium]|nr:hypothetical protein [Bacillota bacterium]
MKKIYYLPNRLSNTLYSYEYLCELNEMLKDHHQTKIRLSLKSTTFIQPNLIAVLGFIIENAKLNGNSIILCDLQPQIKTLLKNYQFIEKTSLNKEHYMPYKTFKHSELQAFDLYIESALTYIKDIKLKDLIKTRLTEIFVNGVNHGILNPTANEKKKVIESTKFNDLDVKQPLNAETEYLEQIAEGALSDKMSVYSSKVQRLGEVYVCGTINLSCDWLFITIVNRGATFYENVESVYPKIKNYERYECIKWAMEPFNGTKKRPGVGLSVITKELYFKGGYCYCISGDGYYEIKKKKGHSMPFYLNGTIMTLGFPLKNLV